MFEIYYRMLKHDPEGKLVKDTRLVPSGSYVIQFLELIEGLFDGNNARYATSVGGVEQYLVGPYSMENCGCVNAAVSVSTYGIVVGTNAGATAEDNEDYKLDAQIGHSAIGTPGTMNYRDVTFVAPHVDGDNVDFDVIRSFINETVATITVKEIGIRCSVRTPGYHHLLLRDVVADEEVLADYTLTVIYTLRTTA